MSGEDFTVISVLLSFQLYHGESLFDCIDCNVLADMCLSNFIFWITFCFPKTEGMY